MMLFAQADPSSIASEVVKAMSEHKAEGGGLDSFMFLMALIGLFTGSFFALRWVMTHNQKCVREITTDHKEACKTITDTYKAETAAIRTEHNEDRRAFREGLHAIRNTVQSNTAQSRPTREGSG